jgi:hypothetical protein
LSYIITTASVKHYQVLDIEVTKSWKTLPVEIILAIGDQCTPFDRLKLKQPGLPISPSRLQHSLVWLKVFKQGD